MFIYTHKQNLYFVNKIITERFPDFMFKSKLISFKLYKSVQDLLKSYYRFNNSFF